MIKVCTLSMFAMFFRWTELFIIVYLVQILQLNGHTKMMFLIGINKMLMIMKVLWMAEECHHNLILLFLSYMNQRPCTEHPLILSSKGSNNISSSNLVNRLPTGLINICMVRKPLRMANDGHQNHIPPLHTYQSQGPCIEHLYILTSSRNFLIFLVNQFWYRTPHLLLILHLVVDLIRLLQVRIQAT